jgi:putative chitinase
MELTKQQLKSIMPYALSKNLDKYLPLLNELMPKFGIDGRLRVCHFIAQVAHESGEFRYSQEIASGKAYDTGRLAVALGNTPEADGDGQKYKGRGLIQLTGANNYRRFNEYLKANFEGEADVLEHPEVVATPYYAVMTACWFFKTSGCLALADKDDIRAVTKRVNGGYNGFKQRYQYLVRAKKVIK